MAGEDDIRDELRRLYGDVALRRDSDLPPVDNRQYAAPYTPPEERGFLLPISRQGGELRPAVPGIIHDPWEALKRLMDRGYQPGTQDEQGVRDAFDVAGAVAMPSLAMRAPAGALAAGAARREAPSAMDEASRLARAKEQGWSPGWYHGTAADKFDEFRPNTYVTNRPEEASLYAEIAARQDTGRPSVLPLHTRGERFATQADLDAAEAALSKGSWWPGSSPKRPPTSQAVYDELRRRGFQGFEESDASGRTMRVMFDPKNIRSSFAAFDPAQSDSASLLAANNRNTALPGAAMSAAEHGNARVGPEAEKMLRDTYGAAQTSPEIAKQIADYQKEGIFLRKGDAAYEAVMPLDKFNGKDIRASQQSVDAKGLRYWKKQIEDGARPAVLLAPTDNGYRIVDGHTRATAYRDLGVNDIPVLIRERVKD